MKMWILYKSLFNITSNIWKNKWNQKKINLNTDLNTQTQWLSYSINWESCRPLYSFGSTKRSYNVNLKRNIIVSSRKSYYTKIPLCSNTIVLMNLHMHIRLTSQYKFSTNWNRFSQQPLSLSAADNVWYAILTYNNICTAWKIKEKLKISHSLLF